MITKKWLHCVVDQGFVLERLVKSSVQHAAMKKPKGAFIEALI